MINIFKITGNYCKNIIIFVISVSIILLFEKKLLRVRLENHYFVNQKIVIKIVIIVSEL